MRHANENVTKLSSSAILVYERPKTRSCSASGIPEKRLVESDLVYSFESNRASFREAAGSP